MEGVGEQKGISRNSINLFFRGSKNNTKIQDFNRAGRKHGN